MIFDKILSIVPTQAVGIILAALAIWWIEPATPYGMAVLGILVLALTNAVKQSWDWFSPMSARGGKPKPVKPASLKPKRKPAR